MHRGRRAPNPRAPRPTATFPPLIAVLVALAALGAAAVPAGAAGPARDKYGGFESIGADATGRFRVDRIDGVWWFVDPDGHGFFSSGLNNVNIAADFSFVTGNSPYLEQALEAHGSAADWAAATTRRLRRWGVNTLGAFSLPNLFRGRVPYTVLLNFTQHAPIVGEPTPSADTVRDFVGPWFDVAARAYAVEAASNCAADPWCIGVFTDNEPSWGRSVRQATSFLLAYAASVPGSDTKTAAQRFLERRYSGDIAAFNATWGTQLSNFDAFQQLPRLPPDPGALSVDQIEDDHAFRDVVARRYFRVTDAALRAVSQDLLNLGPRFDALNTPGKIYEIAGRSVDVISLNDYEYNPAVLAANATNFGAEGFLFRQNPWDDLDTVERLAERPILITEFSYRASVPGGPLGTNPPAFVYSRDQAERAAQYRAYMAELYSRPFVVGAHWFQLMDQPAAGRADGQDNNFGLVDIEDRPWRPLTDAFVAESRALPGVRTR